MKHEPMTQERIDAIRGRVDAAERGPWEVENGGANETSQFLEGPEGSVLVRNWRGSGYLSEEYVWVEKPNAEFIAHAREDIPALLAEVKRLRALTIVDDGMVERAAFTLARRFEKHPYLRVGAVGHDFTPDARAALDAALGTGEGQ